MNISARLVLVICQLFYSNSQENLLHRQSQAAFLVQSRLPQVYYTGMPAHFWLCKHHWFKFNAVTYKTHLHGLMKTCWDTFFGISYNDHIALENNVQ